VLPDLLAPGLLILFCGTAAGNVSAARGHYYAHPQNKFWKTLENIKLTSHEFMPCDFRQLLACRVGLTDIAKNASGMDKELPADCLGRSACAALRTNIEKYQPRLLAFTSLNAGRRFLHRHAGFGEQEDKIGQTRVWVLPSPSPAAAWHWDITWWQALADEAQTLRSLQAR
jgi:TDG/mug DNA glycosylase family protein